MSFLSKLAKKMGFPPKPPKIRIDEFVRQSSAEISPSSPMQSRVPGKDLLSDLCRFDALDSPNFRKWIAALQLPWAAHRKQWELAYILQGLDERGMIGEERRGLGFAVGQERLPALLASHGCTIVATDLGSDDDRALHWAKHAAWAADRDRLNRDGLCDPEIFDRNVTFRPVDMNAIPDDLTGFDFTWSTCSFEHCGSIELGLQFLSNQMRCLKPGGVAIHTTEFNLTSNTDTLTDGMTVAFRLQDIQHVVRDLRASGHHVEPLDLRLGDHAYDQWVDPPPYNPGAVPHKSAMARLDKMFPGRTGMPGHERPHLRLKLGKYASTSVGLIIRKKNEAGS